VSPELQPRKPLEPHQPPTAAGASETRGPSRGAGSGRWLLYLARTVQARGQDDYRRWHAERLQWIIERENRNPSGVSHPAGGETRSSAADRSSKYSTDLAPRA
jgi:hypothetical protein